MLGIVSGHMNYLKEVKMSMPVDGFHVVCDQHVVDLVSSIKFVQAPGMGDAATALSLVRDSVLDDAGKAKVVAAINSVATSAPAVAGPSGSTKQQEHFFMHRYLTESDWAVLLDETLLTTKKIDVLVNRCRRIGLFSMTERTSGSIATVLALVNGDVDVASHYEVLTKLKASVKKMRAASRQDGVATPTCERFPAAVETFQATHPDRYESPPVPSKLNEDDISSAKLHMPCRKSHNTLRAPCFPFQPPSRGSSSSSSSAMNKDFMHMIMPLMHAMVGNQAAVPNLVMSRTRRASFGDDDEQRAKRQALPAILDGVPQNDSQSSADLVAVSPAPKVGIAPSSPPSVSTPIASAGLDEVNDIVRAALLKKAAAKVAASGGVAAESEDGCGEAAKHTAPAGTKAAKGKAKATDKDKATDKTTDKPAKAAGKTKARRNDTAAHKPKGKDKAKAKAGGIPSPCIAVEKSRSQVLARVGPKGPGMSKTFKYDTDPAPAKAAAAKWLKETCKKLDIIYE